MDFVKSHFAKMKLWPVEHFLLTFLIWKKSEPKVFNWSEFRFSEVTSYKIHTLVLLFLLVNALDLCLVTRYWCGKFNGRNDPSKSGFSVLNQVPNQYIYCSKMLETYRFYNCIFGFWFFWKCFVHIWYNMITSKKRDENHQYPKWYQDQSENGYLSILILIVFPACLIKSLQTSWFMSNTWVPLISTMKSLSFSPVSYAIVLKMIWQKKR